MGDGSISEDIKRFLLENINSIAQWEGLLLLQSQPEKAWDVKEIAGSLYISEHEATLLLTDLELHSIIVPVKNQLLSSYRYKPCTTELDELIKRASELYRRSLIPITNIIHSKSKNRVQEFADAFRIRKG